MPSAFAAAASLHRLVDRQVEDAGHRRHLAPHAFALADEQRQHEHVGRQPRLAHQRAHRRRPAQPPQPSRDGEGCGCLGAGHDVAIISERHRDPGVHRVCFATEAPSGTAVAAIWSPWPFTSVRSTSSPCLVPRNTSRSRRPAPESCSCVGWIVVLMFDCDAASAVTGPMQATTRRRQQIGRRLGAERRGRSCAPPTRS